FLGIHAAADSGYDWPFYGETLGAYFADHSPIEAGVVVVEDAAQVSTAALPSHWSRVDEWYRFRSNPRSTAHVLLRLDDPADRPLAWCRGRSFYTALGHTVESFSEASFVEHLGGALRTAAGLSPCPAP